MPTDPEAVLMRVASRQYSVFAHPQAAEAGVSAKAIRRRVERGHWLRLHRGVYTPASVPMGWEQRVFASWLACGPRAVCSYRSAGAIWGLSDEPEDLHVTVPLDERRNHPGIIIHRSSSLDAVSHRRFRVTSPRRTLVDLAAVENEGRIEQMLDGALRRGLVRLEDMATYLALECNRARPGAGFLRRMIDIRDRGRPMGSELETVLFRLLRRAGLPQPAAQHEIVTRSGRRFVDFAYPGEKLAIEVDGYATHVGRRAFDEDRARQNQLESLGWRVLRFTWTQLHSTPIDVVVTVGSALKLMPVRWAKR